MDLCRAVIAGLVCALIPVTLTLYTRCEKQRSSAFFTQIEFFELKERGAWRQVFGTFLLHVNGLACDIM